MDTSLCKREVGKDLIIVEIYMDDIIFGATNESMWKDFYDLMKNKFERQQRYTYSSIEIH